MTELCADIGYYSLNKYSEELCGDQVNVVEQGNKSIVAVLADGLGSGVKACILSTLTAKIISTMVANDMALEDCVTTIAATLPVCAIRNVAYSTFTIIRISQVDKYAEIIQYDNPNVILIRNGKLIEFPTTEMFIDGKRILKSRLSIDENDVFIAMSDGATYAGVGKRLNFGWQRENIAKFMVDMYDVGFTAKTLSTILLEQCNKLYENQPGDDTTVCVVKIRRREPVNLIIGPPKYPYELDKMMSLFFAKKGKHIVCGGTTSALAAEYLCTPLMPTLDYIDDEIPPMATINGVDLVTEGVITINKVLSYAQNYLDDNQSYKEWSYKKDGASRIARMLFEDATDINFYVGTAVNPAHQNPDLPISFHFKMRLVNELSECLKKMGKQINVSYF